MKAKKQITVGTCIPGNSFESWAPGMLKEGFETFEICFHMSLGGINLDEFAPKVRSMLDGTGVKVSALGFYSNPLLFEEHERTLHECIDIAEKLGTDTIATFAGGIEGKPVEESMPRFKQVFGELTRHAEDKGVKIAIENCPMGGSWYHALCNIGFNPRAWDMMFNEVSSDALGLEWEPAHMMVQLIEPIACLRKYAEKVVHIHAKDGRIRQDVLSQEGYLGKSPFFSARFPGFGDTDWREVFEILQNAGYEGDMAIEGYHDFLYNGDWEMTGQKHSLKYLKWCRGGDFAPNPWN